jgi:MFS family permease
MISPSTGYLRSVAGQREAHRVALGNRSLVRYVGSHLLAVNAEWAVFIGLLVYVHERSGTRATGFASIAMLVPYVVVSPFAGEMAERYRPSRVRLAGLGAQAVGYGISAVAAYQGSPVWVAVFGTMIALGATTTLRPSGAVLLPAMVRSSRELTVANLWVGYAESTAVLVGPMIATALLAIDGARLALAGCAVLAATAAVLASIGIATDPPAVRSTVRRGALRTSVQAVSALRRRTGAIGVLTIAGGQFFLVGALDLVIVVSAQDVLDMGEAGAGVLSTVFGLGSVLSVGVTTMLVRRRRLATYLIASLVMVVAMSVAFGVSMTIATALVALPLLGLSRSSLDLLARMMLQRSAPPNELSLVFAVLESTGGVAVLLGSLVAQVLIAWSGPQAAMFGVAGFFVLMLLATAKPLRHADEGADIPVVAMSLFRRDPVFSPLPAGILETVARTAEEVVVERGEIVIRQGDPGDRYYIVADGTLEITSEGQIRHVAERGDGFGEVALLANVPRTATVTATRKSTLLAVGRVPFLLAVTGHDSSRQAAWGVIHAMDLGDQLPS